MFNGRYQPQLGVEGWDEEEGEEGGKAGSVHQQGEQSLQSTRRECTLGPSHSIPTDFILFQWTPLHSK